MFKLGIVLAIAVVVLALFFGQTPSDNSVRILAVIAGWFLFAPVRRLLFGGEPRKDPERP